MRDKRRPEEVAALVPHGGIRCEASNHRVDIVRVLRLEIAIKNVWQIQVHGPPPIGVWNTPELMLYFPYGKNIQKSRVLTDR